MKKVMILLLAALLTVSAAGCGGDGEAVQSSPEYEIAMITESETVSIDDGGSTQDTWEGLRRYAEDSGITFKYYEPAEDSDDGRLEQIDAAAQAGAKVIVCCGEAFQRVIYTAQSKYEDLTFLYVDGTPLDEEGKSEIAENCLCISFNATQAGFLAGYSAVMEGYSSLGFMAKGKSSAVKRYGYGFLQGCNQAAEEKGWYVDVNYKYFDQDESAARIQSEAEKWYAGDTELIFACGSGIFDSVAVEAEIADAAAFSAGRVSSPSKNILGSVVKECGNAVYAQLSKVYDGSFEGGKTVTAGVSDSGISVPVKQGNFQVFTAEDYQAVCKELTDGTIKLAGSKAKTVNKLIENQGLTSIQVSVQ